jgi:uncharacterized protein YecE (DUF72 family)
MADKPEQKAKVLVGTSGYSYDDWVGPFYPEGMEKKDFLGYYAAQFPVVELNFSYYTQPKATNLARMIEKTPEGFRFAVKAHQSLTHNIGEDFEKDVECFKRGIVPLVEAGRLAAVLFQFPYSFHYTPPCRKHLQTLCEVFEEIPTAVEFRNAEWQRNSVYDGLKAVKAGFVNVDEPRLPKLPEPSEVVTSELGYIRFHGRNSTNWWGGDNVSRYDYLYSSEELAQWLPTIERMLTKATLLLVIFNNHSRGKAIQNARDIQGMLFS